MDGEIQVDATTDAAAVAGARRLGPAPSSCADTLLRSLPIGPDDPRLASATSEERAVLLLGLERIADAGDAPDYRRDDAVRLLLGLAPDRGWSRVEALLGSPEASARRRGLSLAAAAAERGRPAVVRGLSDPDPDIQEAALGHALRLGVAGAADPERVAGIVARLLSAAGATWSRVSALRSVLALEEGEAPRRAREGLHAFVAAQRSNRAWRDATLALIEHAPADDERWLRSLLEQPPEAYITGRALVALARFRKTAFLGELERWTRDPMLAVHAVEAIGIAARGSGSPVAVRLLRSTADNLDYRGPGRLIHALLMVGGQASRRELANYLTRVRDNIAYRPDVVNALWVLRSMRPSSGAAQLFELGVSPSLPDAPQLARLDAEAESTLMPYSAALGVLAGGFVVAMFDAEASRVPCGHDRPLVLLQGFSRGHFVPEAVVEECERAPGGKGPDRYTLRFLHGARLYRVRFPNEGDYYNVRAIEAAANAALRDAGRPERFQQLLTGDQMAVLLFADPDRVRQASARLLLATENAGAAIAAAIDALA